ncbi:isochorismatase family protein [Sphingomonadaceae bacterium G21617-S1]|jgi:maleamate amidohydrolase|uniref:isochorismatase family protein n=1 Tax=Rhizorhabdus sp. TaxID=1968843 RepID=UPI0022C8A0AF|nr:isochorismatase family protein [Rhizorhabdus sp.]MCZ4341197.1 isochorismatase family protein [Sphingomonadaceae bacterium G21617-S1]
MERIWDRFLTEQDKAVFAAAGYNALAGFGKRPALLVVDVSYGFAGDRPEPILDSIKRWSNSCGEQSWDAIAVIKQLTETFRAKKLPVIYSTSFVRPDNWDSGGWSWKNTRTKESTPPQGNDLNANDIVAEIAPQPQDLVILKQKPSVFFGSNLLSYLTLLGCDSVIVTGTSTSGCVRATVVDAFSYNYRVAVAEDGCFDRSELSHALSLCEMHAKYADVVPSTNVLDFVATLSNDLFPNLPTGGSD